PTTRAAATATARARPPARADPSAPRTRGTPTYVPLVRASPEVRDVPARAPVDERADLEAVLALARAVVDEAVPARPVRERVRLLPALHPTATAAHLEALEAALGERRERLVQLRDVP